MALFTTAEARAFKVKGQTPLSNATTYPDADITAAHDRIKERFEDICGVAFEPTTVTKTLAGNGDDFLVLPNLKVTGVTSATLDGSALTVGDLKVYDWGEVYYSGGWASGYQNISITYTHGWPAVPKPIKWAALIVCVNELTQSDVSSRAISHTDSLGTTRLAIPNANYGHWYGIPSVDSVLQEYSAQVPVIG